VPWRSGTIDREQGISKAGNPRLRQLAKIKASAGKHWVKERKRLMVLQA
jgi:transposase